MAQRCKTCDHPQVNKINERLIAGARLREIAKAYGLGLTSISRHRAAHIVPVISQAQEAKEIVIRELAAAHELQQVSTADSLLAKVQSLQCEVLDIFQKAKDGNDPNTALRAIDQARKLIELTARMLEILKPADVQVNFSCVPAMVGAS